MTNKRADNKVARDWFLLPEILARVNGIQQYGPEEAWSLVHNLSCIEKSCTKLTTELFPRLVPNQLGPDDIDDILHDIGEELRHIAYHIGDSSYYKYLGVTTPQDEPAE